MNRIKEKQATDARKLITDLFVVKDDKFCQRYHVTIGKLESLIIKMEKQMTDFTNDTFEIESKSDVDNDQFTSSDMKKSKMVEIKKEVETLMTSNFQCYDEHVFVLVKKRLNRLEKNKSQRNCKGGRA